MKLAIGSDHAGFDYKEKIKKYLIEKGHKLEDCGTYSADSTDYPDYAHKVATIVEGKNAVFGILVCGSGNGVAITANKHQKIRAALCWKEEISKLARSHNNANVLCIPSRFISFPETKKVVDAFLTEKFEGGRHLRRVKKISC